VTSTPAAAPRGLAAPLAAAALLSLAGWLLQSQWGWGNWDEGYLWYGVREVLRGAVPIRDFMAYDPGRYFWGAAFAWLRGDDGPLTVRLASTLFQAAGLGAGLVALWRASGDAWIRALGATVVAAWIWPLFRAYDCGATLLLLAVAAAVVASPDARRAFVAGLMVGALAIVGRNHGVYGAAGTFVALLLGAHAHGARGSMPRLIGLWAAGIAVGYAPMALALAFDPGLRAAFIEDNLDLFRAGATNITLPVPWPHRAFAAASGFEAWRQFGLGWFFVALAAFPVAGAVRAWRLGREGLAAHPLFVACVALSLPYAHFAFSRADLSHMANGIAPLLLGLLAWPGLRAPSRRVVAVALLAATALVVGPRHPGIAGRVAGDWVTRKVGGDELRMPAANAHEVDRLHTWVSPPAAGRERDVFIAPYGPGAYAALGRRSPTWEVYALVGRPPAFEDAEIARLEAAGVRLAMIQDFALDGRDDLRYRNTHPRIQAWLDANFRVVGRDGDVTVLARRDGAGAAR
jgi:hypothetical protein